MFWRFDSAYGFREEFNLSLNNSKGVECLKNESDDFFARFVGCLRSSSCGSWEVSFGAFGSGVDPLGERFSCNRFTDCELLAVLTFTITSSSCSWARQFTLTVPRSKPGVEMGTGKFNAGCNVEILLWTSILFRGSTNILHAPESSSLMQWATWLVC